MYEFCKENKCLHKRPRQTRQSGGFSTTDTECARLHKNKTKVKHVENTETQLLTKFSVGEGRWGAEASSQCSEEDGTPQRIHTTPA